MGIAMNESTTKQLEKILSSIDSEKQMETFMEEPKVTDGFHTFPEYYNSLPSVQALDNGELIQRSALERSYFYQVMKGTRSPAATKSCGSASRRASHYARPRGRWSFPATRRSTREGAGISS